MASKSIGSSGQLEGFQGSKWDLNVSRLTSRYSSKRRVGVFYASDDWLRGISTSLRRPGTNMLTKINKQTTLELTKRYVSAGCLHALKVWRRLVVRLQNATDANVCCVAIEQHGRGRGERNKRPFLDFLVFGLSLVGFGNIKCHCCQFMFLLGVIS